MLSVSQDERKGANDDVEFGMQPCVAHCPHCARETMTCVDYNTSWISLLVSVACCCTVGMPAALCIPFIVMAGKDVVHHCPRCLNELGKRSRVQCMPRGVDNQVVTIQVGSCAMVLSKRYLLAMAALASVVGLVFLLRRSGNNVLAPSVKVGPFVPTTYVAFEREVLLTRNPLRTSKVFGEQFRGKNVAWKGKIVEVVPSLDLWFFRTSSYMTVQMAREGPASPLPLAVAARGRARADVIGFFSGDLDAEVAEVANGDWLNLNMTLVQPGRSDQLTAARIWGFERAGLELVDGEPAVAPVGAAKEEAVGGADGAAKGDADGSANEEAVGDAVGAAKEEAVGDADAAAGDGESAAADAPASEIVGEER